MISRFIKVTKNLYRGSAPTPQDVIWLKNNLHINKIISLDRESGEKINNICKILGINHIKLYLNGDRASLINLLKQNLKKLLIDNGPTFVHCMFGKDRTGLLIALFKCKYMNMDPEQAIKEAESLGFGIGVDPRIVLLYKKLIRACKSSKDSNNADIVSNEREYIGDGHDSYLDEGHQGSFAPYLDYTRKFPTDLVYSPINDQSPTRENYKPHKEEDLIEKNTKEQNKIPEVGIFNNDAGIEGAGPTENAGGFIYD